LIAYFDTSAVVPLLIEEVGSSLCQEHWSAADRLVSVRLVRVEAHAALAQATRQDRLTARQLRTAVRGLDTLIAQLDMVDVDDELTRSAAEVAERQGLRAYDAVHLAAALAIVDDDLVLVTGDHALASAATSVGVAVAETG
jgi:predicted nucleic acid-binding protein